MPIRAAIVGPGRVGRAFARHLARQPRVELLGFVGRSPAAAKAACAFAGAGSVLSFGDLAAAHVVIFAVGDAQLSEAIAAAIAAVPPRQCALWLHTSGRFGLEVFDAVRSRGVRCGALHPVAPFPDAENGVANMRGAPAVWCGDTRSERLLVRLAGWLSMTAIRDRGGDRVLYHAACVMAANGLTALRSIVDGLFTAAAGLDAPDAAKLAEALMGNALRTSAVLGPAAALSGPVARGDAATVAVHLQRMALAAPAAVASYRALMVEALALAIARGLDPGLAKAVRTALLGPAAGPGGVQTARGD